VATAEGKPKLYITAGATTKEPATSSQVEQLKEDFDLEVIRVAERNCRLKQGETPKNPPIWQTTGWETLGRNKYFFVTFPTDEDLNWTKAWLPMRGLGGISKEEAPVLHRFSGFIRGVSAKQMKSSFFKTLISSYWATSGLCGTVVVNPNLVSTPGGAILELALDDLAADGLASKDFLIPMGSRGLVPFTPSRSLAEIDDGKASEDVLAAKQRLARATEEVRQSEAILEEIRAKQAAANVQPIAAALTGAAVEDEESTGDNTASTLTPDGGNETIEMDTSNVNPAGSSPSGQSTPNQQTTEVVGMRDTDRGQ